MRRMKFDRSCPFGAMELYTKSEPGKVFLECKLHLKSEETRRDSEVDSGYLEVEIRDKEERLVFYCRQAAGGEEPIRGILLHPHLWQGVESPYRYFFRARIWQDGSVADTFEQNFILCEFRHIPGKGWYLNGEAFEMRQVCYEIPEDMSTEMSAVAFGEIPTETYTEMSAEKNAEPCLARMRRDLKGILEMGANTVCPVAKHIPPQFFSLCEEMGLVVCQNPCETPEEARIVRFNGLTKEQYYQCKAHWSREPFVYINPDSLLWQENGNAEVMVYSNQKKVALYVEGVLFEFRSEGPEFRFQEIPAKKLPLRLSAEAEECTMSVTAKPVHRIFTK